MAYARQASCFFNVSSLVLPQTNLRSFCTPRKANADHLILPRSSPPAIIQCSFVNSRRFSFEASTKNRRLPLHGPSAVKFLSYALAAETFHNFSVKDIDGNEVSLDKYKGKVLLIVNVASKCGLTTSNYSELSHLYEKYKAQGFEILAFPCNQFGGQEPGKNTEIKEFACTRFKAEFPIFDKIDVNGPKTAPVYNFLKSSKGGGLLGDNIKWNFEKFLVDKDGKVVERYLPTTSPFQIEKDIQNLLAA